MQQSHQFKLFHSPLQQFIGEIFSSNFKLKFRKKNIDFLKWRK